MIYDTLSNVNTYAALSPRLHKALEYLASTDFSQVADGRYELEGDALFVNVMSVTTNPRPAAGSQRLEAHDKYLDVQYLAAGEEVIGVAPRAALGACEPDEGDICFLTGRCTYLPMGRGQFLVVWPQDAHAPCVAVDAPAPVRRVVAKVRIED